MKRFFILASAAIVALASCAKTEVVYKNAPEQIAFKQITDVMTKADLPTDVTLGVTAHDANGDVYFTNYKFEYSQTTAAWANSNAFWPYEGALTFTVYAPYGTASYEETTETLETVTTVTSKLLTISGVTADDEVYFGTGRFTYSKPNKVNNATPAVNLELKHLCAEVTVNIDLGTAYELNGNDAITLATPTTVGDVTVEYVGATPVVATKTARTNDNVVLNNEEPMYVLPGDQTSIVVKFKQKAAPQQEYSKAIPLNTESAKWEANTKYVYNIGITDPEAITFTTEVVEWDGPESVSESLN